MKDKIYFGRMVVLLELEKIKIMSSHGFNMKLLLQNVLASERDRLDFFTPKSVKLDFLTPNKQGTFQCALTPIYEYPFTLNTLESLDKGFGPSKQVARACPAKSLHMRNKSPLVNYFPNVLSRKKENTTAPVDCDQLLSGSIILDMTQKELITSSTLVAGENSLLWVIEQQKLIETFPIIFKAN